MSAPRVVCLCGSSRFGKEFAEANLRETLAGKIVLTIGCNMKEEEIFRNWTEEDRAAMKATLCVLHLRKIDLADEILVLNVDGYMGESTRLEVEYAYSHDKKVRYLEEAEE